MQIEIDNLDGGGLRDYTFALDAEHAPALTRKLNRPAEMQATLVAAGAEFVAPAGGARVVLSEGGQKLFTGYLAESPAYEYLGWGERGPVYRLVLKATSDEALLDRKRLPDMPSFVNRDAAEVVRQMTEALLPGAFDLGAVENTGPVSSYYASPQRTWSEHAGELALRTRAAYRAHDGRIAFAPVGTVVHQLREDDAQFRPEALVLHSPATVTNDLTVTGRTEPRACVKDYFLGDGYSGRFYLSEAPFSSRASFLLDEEYAQLDPKRWTASGAVSAVGGKLAVNGAGVLRFHEQVELGGALVLQHGEFEFASLAGDALLGGLYDGEVSTAQCVAAFRVSADGKLTAVINGATTGASVSLRAGRRYALTTRVFADEAYRREQAFHSSNVVRGGDVIPSAGRVVLNVHDIDPADPATLLAASTVLWDGHLEALPAFATYAVVNAVSLNASVPFTRVLRTAAMQVETQIPGQAPRVRLAGTLTEGDECGTSSTMVSFFDPYVPAPNEAIRVRYRTGETSSARVSDAASIAALAGGNDNGTRGAGVALRAPLPRTCNECELAALTILDDTTQRAWAGEYIFSEDVQPGDAVEVDVPSRAAQFTAIVREVEMVQVPGGVAFRAQFANDAAAPLAYDVERQNVAIATDVPTSFAFLPDLLDAEVTKIESTAVTIDAGVTPIAGGGIEVRRSDRAWGAENDYNLAGRFAARTFTLPRLSRVQTYYLKQYDAAGRYSRNTTVLHIDYPL